MDHASRALLPAGLRDLLPPEAAHEARVVESVLARFAAHGYERVKPPLMEFEGSLFAGPGAALAGQTFRVMDPASQGMMGVRADITPQAARLAATRLGGAERPLRLSYAGEVLRVRGGQLRPERQFAQAGLELIGATGPRADAEVMALTVDALAAQGVEGLSIDLTLPTLVPVVLDAYGVTGEAARRLSHALDHKDAGAVAAEGGPAATLLKGLIDACGPAERALEAMNDRHLPPAVAAEKAVLADVVALLHARLPDVPVTVDLVERRGLEYHAGVGFAVFARHARGELASGGRYRAAAPDGPADAGEPATGASLYLDAVLATLAAPAAPARLFVPAGAETDPAAAAWRRDGGITVAGVDDAAAPRAEARRLGCTHVLEAGRAVPVPETEEG